MGLEIIAVEGIEELKNHEKAALRYLQENIAGPGYIVPSLMVQKLISNREIDAVMLLPDMLVLVELKDYTGSRIDIRGLNSPMLIYSDDAMAKKWDNPCRNLAYSAKVLSKLFKQANIKSIPIIGLLIFTNTRLRTLIVQGQAIGNGHDVAKLEPKSKREEKSYRVMGGVAVCRLSGMSGALQVFRKGWGKKRTQLSQKELEQLQKVVLHQMTPCPPEARQRIGSYIVDKESTDVQDEDYRLLIGRQAITGLPVWIKEYRRDILSLDPESDAELLLRGAVALSELGAHPNLPAYQDYYEVSDCMYVVFKREPGRFLHQCMEAGDLSTIDKLKTLMDILVGLTHIHSHKEGELTALYRDLRPESVFVTESRQAQLFNFDCTRLPSRSTAFGQAKERADRWRAYASFEFLDAQTPEQVDTPTDIYSWGIVAYELLTGKLPYASEKELAQGKFIPLSEFNLSIPQSLQASIEQAISPQTGLRPSLTELQTAVQEAMSATG